MGDGVEVAVGVVVGVRGGVPVVVSGCGAVATGVAGYAKIATVAGNCAAANVRSFNRAFALSLIHI